MNSLLEMGKDSWLVIDKITKVELYKDCSEFCIEITMISGNYVIHTHEADYSKARVVTEHYISLLGGEKSLAEQQRQGHIRPSLSNGEA